MRVKIHHALPKKDSNNNIIAKIL